MKSKALFWTGLFLMGCAGALLVWQATPLGTGLSPDSINYIEGARNLAVGRGYASSIHVAEARDLIRGHGYSTGPVLETAPITHWPPFYSMILACGGKAGLEPWAFSRWLNAILLALNLGWVGYIARRFSGATAPAALLGAFFILTSWQFLSAHTYALSEPLFTCLVLAALALLLHHLESPSVIRLALAAVMLSLATLTRYFALPLIVASVFAVAWFSRSPWRRRLLEMIGFTLLALTGFAAFSVRNRLLSGAGSDVPIEFQGVPWSFATDLLTEFYYGFFPRLFPFDWIPVVAGGLALLGLAGYAVADGIRLWRSNGNGRSLAVVAGLFAAAYLAFLIFGVLFISRQMRWEFRRYLAPFQPLVIVLLLGLLAGRFIPAPGRRWMVTTVIVAMIGLLFVSTARAAKWLQQTRKDGQQYASVLWRDSPTLAYVRPLEMRSGATFFSNAYDVIPFFTGRTTRPLPVRWNPVSEKPVANLEEQFRAVRQRLLTDGGWVVWFNASKRDYVAPLEMLEREVGLTVVTNFPDGVVLKAVRH